MIFNEETRQRVLEAVRVGCFKTTAASYAGIHRQTLESWLLRGRVDANGKPIDTRPDVEEYVAFREAFDKERALTRVNLLREIITDKDWRAKSWAVDRLEPPRKRNGVFLSDDEDSLDPDARADAVNELRTMSCEMAELIEHAWCNPDLAHAPAGVRQIWKALGERWGW